MPAAEIHEARSQAIADEIRRFLIGANTGGIAAVVTLTASFSPHVAPRWAVTPIAFYLLGVSFAAISYFLAQHREIRRREAARSGEPEPHFTFFQWSWLWNLLGAGSFLIASIFGLLALVRFG